MACEPPPAHQPWLWTLSWADYSRSHSPPGKLAVRAAISTMPATSCTCAAKSRWRRPFRRDAFFVGVGYCRVNAHRLGGQQRRILDSCLGMFLHRTRRRTTESGYSVFLGRNRGVSCLVPFSPIRSSFSVSLSFWLFCISSQGLRPLATP